MNRPLIHIETDWPNTWQRSSPPSGQPRCQHLKSTDPPPLTLQVERQSLINSLLTVCLYASEFFFCESISVRSVGPTSNAITCRLHFTQFLASKPCIRASTRHYCTQVKFQTPFCDKQCDEIQQQLQTNGATGAFACKYTPIR